MRDSFERREIALRRLVTAVQDLSLARSLDDIRAIVRRAARELTGADGATFVLRDGDLCHYVDEDAIGPLWKGQRFPMSACISGWAMLNRRAAAIEDIFADPRIPVDAYRPTFVKSLAMVPIRTREPIGAIGNYWASRHAPREDEVELLQALADATSVAMENVRVHDELEDRVRARTAELEQAYRELESFSYSVSHDLRAPLRSIEGFSRLLAEDAAARLSASDLRTLERVQNGCSRMSTLIDNLFGLARVATTEPARRPVDLAALAREAAERLGREHPERRVEFSASDAHAEADPGLLLVAFENLLGNAWKFTAGREAARVEFGVEHRGDKDIFFVRDDGAGFDSASATGLFEPFHRFHSADKFQGTGIGLATVARVIRRHGGRIWAESSPGKGAAFYFTLS